MPKYFYPSATLGCDADVCNVKIIGKGIDVLSHLTKMPSFPTQNSVIANYIYFGISHRRPVFTSILLPQTNCLWNGNAFSGQLGGGNGGGNWK
jgi:hypothetical protein